MPYPLMDFIATALTPLASVAKLVSSRNVVLTGILMRVRTSRNRGAATWRNLNSVGAVSKPLLARRP